MLLILTIKYIITTVKCITDQNEKVVELASMFTHFSSTNQEKIFSDVNSIFVEICKSSTNKKYNIICGCIYRPPILSLLVFNDLLTKMFNKIQGDNKYLYITGDFNVNTLPHMKKGPSTQEFTNKFSSNYCFPFINKPTRVTDHSASLIDNI